MSLEIPYLRKAYHWMSWRSGTAMRSARRVRKARIINYHAVGPQDTPAELFDWQLQFLRQEFEFMPLPKLLDRLATDRLTGDEVAITFDDGVRNHVTRVYPLLVSNHAHATFFVCPGLIDSGRWIWNMELRVRLRLLSAEDRARLAAKFSAAAREVEELVQWAKGLPHLMRLELEEDVHARTREFEPGPELMDRFQPMSWPQAASLSRANVTIGSHTLTHPVLTTLDEAGRRTEICQSRILLESRIGRAVDLFCYPNGSHDPSTVAIAREHYRASLVTGAGFVEAGQDLHRVPRVPAGQHAGLFVRRLHRPTA